MAWLYMQGLHKVLNTSKYGSYASIIPEYARVLNMRRYIQNNIIIIVTTVIIAAQQDGFIVPYV